MKLKFYRLTFFTIGAFVGYLIVALIFLALPDYKQGQIDALTGKIKYELKTQSDSTRVWERIVNPKQ